MITLYVVMTPFSEEGLRGVFSTKELARGQVRKDMPAYRDEKELDDWIDEFILDEGMD
jgi:hypothetical protein